MYIHFSQYANQPKCIVDTADIWKTLDVFNIYFFGQWFVEIKLKKLSILTCEFVSNVVARYWYKMVATPCSRHDLWLCKAILQVSTNTEYFFLTYTEKCDGRNLSYTQIKHWLVAQKSPPTPSNGDLPWLVAKNIHSAAILKSCWWWHKLMRFLQFLYCSAQPSEK